MSRFWGKLPYWLQDALIIVAWLACLSALLNAAALILTGATRDDQAIGVLLFLAGSAGAWAIYYWRLLESALSHFRPLVVSLIKWGLTIRCLYGIVLAVRFMFGPNWHPTWWHFWAGCAMIFILARALMWPKEE